MKNNKKKFCLNDFIENSSFRYHANSKIKIFKTHFKYILFVIYIKFLLLLLKLCILLNSIHKR